MAEQYSCSSSNFNWTKKDRTSYIQGNYGKLAREDAQIDSALINAITRHDNKYSPLLGQLDSAIELGVGGSLRGPAFMAPLVHDHGVLHITDVSENNVHATQKEMRMIARGELGIWKQHQDHMEHIHPAWRQAFSRAALLGTYGLLDVGSLQPDMADAISLNYLIESKDHSDVEEWRRDLRLVARAAIRLIHLRQTDGSEGYKAGNRTHLAVNVTRNQTEEELDKLGFAVIGGYTAVASGEARQDDDSYHYSGFSGILAERR